MNATSGKVKEIFVAALELAPDQWGAYLAEACDGDAELCRRVLELLNADAAAGSFLEPPAAGPVATVDGPIREGPGTVIGPYKLVEQIGEGGFGLVFMAEQQQPVRRMVAVKVLKPGMDTRQVIARFEAERQALALMDHPNIARVLDAGETDAGRPHFVMELVRGVSITDYCDRNRLTTRERLELFVHVCQAVQHAHHKGIIHRDIKPSNVMVTLHDDVPVVKVIDFGIAKALGQQLTDKTLVTGFAQMVGTPMYMSPEQAQLSGLDIDTRSDIYSLGVLLYELLTGMTPFDKERLSKAGYDEMRRIIREEEPPRPSTRLSTLGQSAATVSAQRQSDPRRLSQLLRGELDWIAMKALEKDRNRRYETAGAFAADVQRYLHDEAVAACPPSAWYRCRKFARRNKSGLVVAACLLLVVTCLVGSAGWIARDWAARRQAVEFALDKAATLRQQGHWGEAAAVLEQAWQGVGDAGPSDLRQRLAAAQAELALVNRLDAIRQRPATFVEVYFHTRTAERDYAAAFLEAGLGQIGDDETVVAARVRASGVSGQLVAALDDWAYVAAAPASRSWLLAVARRADPDPWADRFRDPAVWRDRQALQALADDALRDDGAKLDELSPQVLVTLGLLLGGGADAVPLLRAAQRHYPSDFWLSLNLGNALHYLKREEEGLGYYRVAVALRPDAIAAHSGLGVLLHANKDLDGAIAEFRKAIAIDPKYASAHRNLGVALEEKNDLDGAMDEYRRAIAIDPNFAYAHYNLGVVLAAKNDPDGAIDEFRKAIAINPNFVDAHNNLGVVLAARNDPDGAIVEYRKALAIDPQYADAHLNLGNALFAKKDWLGAIAAYRKTIDIDAKYPKAHFYLGKALLARKDWPGAIAEYRKAVALDPKHAFAHSGLGLALHEHGDLTGAITEYREAIHIDPKRAPVHYNLGRALYRTKDVAGAIAEFRAAIHIDPNHAQANGQLGQALLQQGRFAEARTATQRSLELLPEREPLRQIASRQLQQCERLIALDEKLSAVLSGPAEPADTAERLALGQLCLRYKHRYATAARFYADAFAADPRPADDLKAGHRYNAACSAALAAAGQGTDADKLGDQEYRRLRQQALAWLRADLDLLTKRVEGSPPTERQATQQRVRYWQVDGDLASVRQAEALQKLSAQEQQAWRKLWADVAELLKKAGDAK